MKEIIDFHPLVASWLTENGYTYRHEVKMPEYGKADFVAYDSDGYVLIVECKIGFNAKDGRSIIQLLDYCRQMPGSRGCYAVPSNLLTDNISRLCDIYDVILLPINVDVVEKEEKFPEYTGNLDFLDEIYVTVAEMSYFEPDQIIKDIIVFHQSIGTSPLLDLCRVREYGCRHAVELDDPKIMVDALRKCYDDVINWFVGQDERYSKQVEAANTLFRLCPVSYLDWRTVRLAGFEVEIIDNLRSEARSASFRGDVTPGLLVDYVLEEYQRIGKDVRWIETQISNKMHIDGLEPVLNAAVTEALTPRHYAIATDDIYVGLWGRTAAYLKKEMELPKSASLRDNQPTLALHYQGIAEEVTAHKLGDRSELTWNEARSIVKTVAQFVGEQAQATSRLLNTDLATGRPLLTG